MRDWLGLVAAELLKVFRRRFTWVLMLALVVALALQASSLNADRIGYDRAEITGEGRYGQPLSPAAARSGEAGIISRMTLPGFLKEVWVITDLWGIFALLILAAVQTGEEYETGTIRTVLARGPGRTRWLLAKLAALFLVTAIAWVVLAAVGGLLGLWTHFEATGGLDLSGVRIVDLTAFLSRHLRSWLAVLPYLSLAVAMAIVGRGSGPSLIVGLVGRFVEVVSGIFGTVLIGMQMAGVERLNLWFRLWASLQTASLEWNSQVWRTWGDPLRWKEILMPTGSSGVMPILPSPLHSKPWLGAAVLLGWTLAWLALATWRLARTDVTA